MPNDHNEIMRALGTSGIVNDAADDYLWAAWA